MPLGEESALGMVQSYQVAAMRVAPIIVFREEFVGGMGQRQNVAATRVAPKFL